eukprot:TRINITY_DN42195_c0_g1_i1.p1 TRINITY_DN42195_c0_g1~~TRINITY_DN42195_c0_g1_i1.p1  ORF type:complete len:988 (+),score=166.00 TRINITY_DN42195_c0_g1_i1:90-3053(+)
MHRERSVTSVPRLPSQPRSRGSSPAPQELSEIRVVMPIEQWLPRPPGAGSMAPEESASSASPPTGRSPQRDIRGSFSGQLAPPMRRHPTQTDSERGDSLTPQRPRGQPTQPDRDAAELVRLKSRVRPGSARIPPAGSALASAAPEADPVAALSARLDLELSQIRAELDELRQQLRPAAHSAPAGLSSRRGRRATVDARERLDPPRDGDADDPCGTVLRVGLLKSAAGGAATVAVNRSDQEDEGTALEYELSGSVWDAVLCLGLPPMGCAGDIAVICCVVVNTVAQVMLCLGIAIETMGHVQNVSNLPDNFRRWRLTVGHDVRYIDRAHTSLVSRLCDKDGALHISGTQLREYNEITAYDSPLGTGVLVFFALMLWLLSVVVEIKSVFTLVQCVCAAPRGADTVLSCGEAGEQLAFLQFSRARYALAMAVALARLAIAVCLGFIGSMYICFTIGLEALLLNAMALVFVLEIDEMIFRALVPQAVQVCVQRVKPLQGPPTPGRVAGCDLHSVIVAVVVIGCLVLCEIFMLAPLREVLDDARTEVCGGKRDFVMTLFPGRLFPLWANASAKGDAATVLFSRAVERLTGVKSYRELGANDASNYAYDAGAGLSNLTYNPFDYLDNISRLSVPFSLAGLLLIERETMAQQRFIRCQDDIGDSIHGFTMRESLREVVYNASVTSCAEVTHLCREHEFTAVRSLCPATCGCDDPDKLLAHHMPQWGCPPTCSASYSKKISSSPCRDWSLTAFREAAYLDDFLNEIIWLLDFIKGNADIDLLHGLRAEDIVAGFRMMGCGAVMFLQNREGVDQFISLCENGELSRPFRRMCPETCECRKGMNFCPTTCPCASDSCAAPPPTAYPRPWSPPIVSRFPTSWPTQVPSAFPVPFPTRGPIIAPSFAPTVPGDTSHPTAAPLPPSLPPTVLPSSAPPTRQPISAPSYAGNCTDDIPACGAMRLRVTGGCDGDVSQNFPGLVNAGTTLGELCPKTCGHCT